MTVRKSISISDGLNMQLEHYKMRYPDNPVNLSRIFQEALETYLWKETEKRLIEKGEIKK